MTSVPKSAWERITIALKLKKHRDFRTMTFGKPERHNPVKMRKMSIKDLAPPG